MAALFCGDTVRAEGMAHEALAIGEALADDTVVFQALYALGPIHNFRGRKDQELAVDLPLYQGGLAELHC
jgi:hypothetical protein